MKPSIAELIKFDRKNPQGAGSALEEKLYLYSLVRMVKPISIVEIGVSRGHITAWLALALVENGKGSLISVDNWSRAHGGQAGGAQHARVRLKNTCMGLDKVVTFVASDSSTYLKSLPANSIDFVWIDGDHSLAGARADLIYGTAAARRLIGVHDTNQQYEGPREAIKELYREDSGFWVKGCRGIWMKDFAE